MNYFRVDDELLVNEDFIGLYEVSSVEASSLFAVIKDTLLRLNLTLSKARGQCYDGVRSGIAKKIQDEQPRVFFSHCYGHAFNLAVSDKHSTMERH